MTDRANHRISLRKNPKQNRSNDLVAAVLQAAIQVLAEGGAQRFTTARVAERAGVSVGSLYQYFPNKVSILFRLQKDEWQQTTQMLGRILGETDRPPLDRLRSLVHAFIRSECDEAAVRVALGDAAPFYRDAPEAHEARQEEDKIIEAFLIAALPNLPDHERNQAGDLIMTTMTSVGKVFSSQPRKPSEIERYSEAMSDMFCAYFVALAKPR